MKTQTRLCGSAHCRSGTHVWLDEGTPYARLSSVNCGAQPDRSPEQLKESDERCKAFIQKILERCKTTN